MTDMFQGALPLEGTNTARTAAQLRASVVFPHLSEREIRSCAVDGSTDPITALKARFENANADIMAEARDKIQTEDVALANCDREIAALEGEGPPVLEDYRITTAERDAKLPILTWLYQGGAFILALLFGAAGVFAFSGYVQAAAISIAFEQNWFLSLAAAIPIMMGATAAVAWAMGNSDISVVERRTNQLLFWGRVSLILWSMAAAYVFVHSRDTLGDTGLGGGLDDDNLWTLVMINDFYATLKATIAPAWLLAFTTLTAEWTIVGGIIAKGFLAGMRTRKVGARTTSRYELSRNLTAPLWVLRGQIADLRTGYVGVLAMIEQGAVDYANSYLPAVKARKALFDAADRSARAKAVTEFLGGA